MIHRFHLMLVLPVVPRVTIRAIAYEKSGRWFTAEEPFLRAKERTDAGSSAFRHPRSELTAPLPPEVEPAFNNRKLHMRLPCWDPGDVLTAKTGQPEAEVTVHTLAVRRQQEGADG